MDETPHGPLMHKLYCGDDEGVVKIDWIKGQNAWLCKTCHCLFSDTIWDGVLSGTIPNVQIERIKR